MVVETWVVDVDVSELLLVVSTVETLVEVLVEVEVDDELVVAIELVVLVCCSDVDDVLDVLVDVVELVLVDVDVVELVLVVVVAPCSEVDVVLDVLVDVVELVLVDVDVVELVLVVVEPCSDVDVVLDVLVDVVELLVEEVDVVLDVVELVLDDVELLEVVDDVEVEVVDEVDVVVVVEDAQPQVKLPFIAVAWMGAFDGSASARAVRFSATCSGGIHAEPSSARVSVTTGPVVPEMFAVPMLTMMTLMLLLTCAAVQLKFWVRVVQAAETRVSSSGTSTRVNDIARTTTSGPFSMETGTLMSVAPGAPHTCPTVTVVVCANASPVVARTMATTRPPKILRAADLKFAPQRRAPPRGVTPFSVSNTAPHFGKSIPFDCFGLLWNTF